MTSARYRDGQYVRDNPSWHAEDAAFKADQVLRMLRAHKLGPSRVCDVGCGTGDVLRHLRSGLAPAAELHGFDISPEAIALATVQETPGLTCRLGDAAELAPHDYDLVLAMDVFEHVEDYFGFLRRIRPLGSTHIFHVPLELTVTAVLRASPFARARRQVGHLHYFSRETALATLEDCGYRVIDAWHTPGAFASARHLRTHLANVPRKLIALASVDLASRILGGWSLLVLARPQ